MSCFWGRIGTNHSKIKQWAVSGGKEGQTKTMSRIWGRMFPRTGQGISFRKSERKTPWFKPWFNIVCTHNQLCVPQCSVRSMFRVLGIHNFDLGVILTCLSWNINKGIGHYLCTLYYTANVYRALQGLCRVSLLWGNPVIFTDCEEIL